MLLDGTANTPLVQKQLAIWLLFGRVIDPTDTAHWPIAPTGDDVSEVLRSMPSIIDGPFRFPKLDQ
jgi:hypothetical protein